MLLSHLQYLKKLFILALCTFLVLNASAERAKDKTDIEFTLSFNDPASHVVHVVLKYQGASSNETVFKMPVWTTGYYQLMNYADQVAQFKVTDMQGNPISWEKLTSNSWKVFNQEKKSFQISYDVKGTRSFVAANIIEEERTYLSPAGVMVYPEGLINHPVNVIIEPFQKWNTIATGLTLVEGKKNTYSAPDFDILYDSPFLMGSKLESLPPFYVKGIPHYFVGYNMGSFDKQQLMNDLQKIVEAAVNLMGDIPYNNYTFLSIGPGNGGIEHLNSASISFSGNSLSTQAGKIRTYSFLAHEFFHHYNVKRIRPIELGPFDYDKGSPTKMLWVSEGISVYYEYILLNRAGFMGADDFLNALHNNILAYEGKPGRLYQTLTEASYNTWSDGPFGRTGDDVNKTISYYEKGPVVGAMLDLTIRNATKNKKSLDDVMRSLYKEYYQTKKRGFTELEFRKTCEKIAGKPLQEVFEYTSTVKELNYTKYFGYAGINIDTSTKIVGGYTGLSVRDRSDSLVVTDVAFESPAWNAGLRRRDIIALPENVQKPTAATFTQIMSVKKTGDPISLLQIRQGKTSSVQFTLTDKKNQSFQMKQSADPNSLQLSIRNDWLRTTH
jgi:predicted metalloprotease with PDZ domain